MRVAECLFFPLSLGNRRRAGFLANGGSARNQPFNIGGAQAG